ncbi:MAG: transmembrane 220 family protein [Pseudomonadota bacterium]
MRTICGLFCVMMILFAYWQYNDPDFSFWGPVYGIAALWTGFAALSPGTIRWGAGRVMLWICLAAAAYGVFHFYPTTENWWMQDVWWETETAREGMGMMIVLLALLAALVVGLRRA